MALSLIQRIFWNGWQPGVRLGLEPARINRSTVGGSDRRVREVLAVFGRAELVRLEDGRHALLGGSIQDRIQAREWISLFGHEVVC